MCEPGSLLLVPLVREVNAVRNEPALVKLYQLRAMLQATGKGGRRRCAGVTLALIDEEFFVGRCVGFSLTCAS